MVEESTAVETKEEVKGTPLLSPEDQAEWGNETRIIESGKAEEVVEEPEPEEEIVDEEPEVEEAPVVLLEDPGEFKPNDYSFKVTTYDEEGKKPKTTTIKSAEQWDEFLEKEPNFGSAAALMKAERAVTKMETASERDQAEWQTKKDAFDTNKKDQEARATATQTMVSEINYLVDKGLLPRVANQFVNADWNDPEVAKQAGVKEQVDLLNYMKKENNVRVKAGLKPMSSIIDAFNAYQLEDVKVKTQTAKQKAAEARKDAGAKVAGSSANPVSSAPKGVMIGRGGNLRDLGNENWGTG